ncbi:MAG: 5-methylcytosine-specific restriction enzyme [Frankiaceae bacterium]|jgi:5-methylcytosine-specific restriction protein B|nr:5-methylcytosine-specific restriction enzyme [Frankiaceae bacterium]
MAEVTRRRLGELQRAVFAVLNDEEDGLPATEVVKRSEEICPATPFEDSDYPNRPGIRRFPRMLRFGTIVNVKAGWLVKDRGTWRVTEAGRDAYARYPDPEEFARQAGLGYKAWEASRDRAAAWTTYSDDEAAADAEAAQLEASASRSRRAWLVRGANVDGTNLVPSWLAGGYCSISYAQVPKIGAGTPRIEIAKLVKDAMPDAHIVHQGVVVGVLDRFVNQMAADDVVATVDGAKVYVGTVTGEAYSDPTPLSERRRPVRWINAGQPFQRQQLSDDAANGLRGQLTQSELTPYLAEFARLAGLDLGATDEVIVEAAAPREVLLPPPDQVLADRLLLPQGWLAETVELLNDKRQVVLYGPPGTGKTYLAQELCKALVESSGGEFAIVQFHPSYAYEDFFEGLRPRPSTDGSGGIYFDVVPGPLRRLAKQATDDPTHPYVLIVDEINRANLAKVFGELYFLLEYRGQSVSLQYSPDESFYLPRNLFLIGTMNTADRSIALVDAAMRRRFPFQGLFPTRPPIAGLLRRWLAANNLADAAAALLEELNRRIADDDFAIGPSYLMSPRVAEPGGLERIWRTAIVPLLEEHYFGEGRDVEAQFGLVALRRATAAPVAEL